MRRAFVMARTPIGLYSACVVGMLTYCAYDDFKMNVGAGVDKTNVEHEELRAIVLAFRRRTKTHTMRYSDFIKFKDVCGEFSYLHMEAVKEKESMMHDLFNNRAAEKTTVTILSNLSLNASRRALLRNGFVWDWWKATVEDEPAISAMVLMGGLFVLVG